MTTNELLEIAKKRGLKIIVKEGRPMIVNPPSGAVTDRLLAVLKIHREKIIAMLSPKGKLP